MPFMKGRKGENGKNKNGRKQGSQRRHLCTRKGSNKSPSVTPITTTPAAREQLNMLGDPNVQRNLNATFNHIASVATPSVRQQPSRTNKIECGVRFNMSCIIYIFNNSHPF